MTYSPTISSASTLEPTFFTPAASIKERLGLTIKIDSFVKNKIIDSPTSLKINLSHSHIATSSVLSSTPFDSSPSVLSSEDTPVVKDVSRQIIVEDEPEWDGTE